MTTPEIPRELLERIAAELDKSMPLDVNPELLPTLIREYRAAKAAAEPKLRTRSEVDADIALIIRRVVRPDDTDTAADSGTWDRVRALCAEPTRPDPAPERCGRKYCDDSLYSREQAARDLIDAIATPKGRDFAHAWEAATMLFGRFGEPATMLRPDVCTIHGNVAHGKEAEELREGIESLIVKRGATVAELVQLLDSVDCRDSLVFAENETDRATHPHDPTLEPMRCGKCPEPAAIIFAVCQQHRGEIRDLAHHALDAFDDPSPSPSHWRTGTKNPHTLYRDDEPAGFLLKPEHAKELIGADPAPKLEVVR